MATRSIAERRRATSTPLTFKLPAPQPERWQAIRALWAVVVPAMLAGMLRSRALLQRVWAVAAPAILAGMLRVRALLLRLGMRVEAAARDAHLTERALAVRAAASRWAALWRERMRQAWRARQAMLAARRQAVVSGRAKPLAADDPTWHVSTAAAHIEFHDVPAPVTIRAMPFTPLPEHLWRQWHKPAADRVPHAPPLRTAAMVAVVACIAVVALSLVTFAAVARNWHGLPTFPRDTTPLHPVVIRQADTPVPNVGQPPYFVGAWVSDSSPMPTSVVTVYVRVTNSATQAPVPGVAVTVFARLCQNGSGAHTFGPAATGADGLAAVQVSFASLPIGQPVCLTANAPVGGQTYTAETTFTAAFPAKPTATPTSADGSGGGGGGGPQPTPTPQGHGRP